MSDGGASGKAYRNKASCQHLYSDTYIASCPNLKLLLVLLLLVLLLLVLLLLVLVVLQPPSRFGSSLI